MKHFTLFKAWLMLCLFLIVGGGNVAWAETKTGSWDLTSASSDWTASLNETYFSQPYGYKKANGTLTNKSISDFETAGISQIKVGFKCLQNGGTTSKLTIYLVDKNGNTLGSGVVVTPDNKSAASQTTYKYATFTTNLTGATGFMMKVTTFGKNILVNGAEYEVTYTSGTPVEKPTNLSAGTPTSTGTTLSWGAVDHATAYKVEYKVSTAGSWTAVTPNPTTNSCKLTGLTPSTTYAWQVTALSTETGYTDGSAQAGTNFTTAAPASHKAYFYVNGTLQNEGGTSFAEGASITFPDDPADIEGKKFMGWTQTRDYSNDTNAPSNMTKSATMGGDDVNYYAVFATSSGSGIAGYMNVTSLTVGKKYIFGSVKAAAGSTLAANITLGAVAFTNTYNSTTGGTWGAKVDLTPDEQGMILADNTSITDACIWTLESVTSGNYAFRNGSNYIYLGNSAGNTSGAQAGISTTSGNMYIENVNSTCKNAFLLHPSSTSTNVMLYNTNSGYRMYNPRVYSATMSPYVRFYEYDAGSTYSDYTTSVVKKYDVTFDLQGHGEAIASQAIAEGETVAEPTTPTATGYTFGGWYKEAECTNAWNFSTDVMGTSAITLYAKWTATNYSITYNNVEGATHSNPATYTIETATINLADASKDGYIFQGWFDNEGLTGDAVTTIAQGSTGDKTFWAKWTEVPANPSTVTFNVGEHGTCETASATEETVGAGVVLPAVIANEGWVFKGWSTENPATAETLVSAGDDGKYHILANTTLYAFYKVKPATPAFSSEAGAIEKGTEVTISCTTEGANIYYTTNGDAPTAESAAYSEAITVSAAQILKAIAILDGEQSEVATAAYTIATHTAQFSINGVITDANNSTVAKGEAITFPADPAAPEEHVFIGWKKGGEEITTPQNESIATVDKTTEVMGTEDVTYYAVWAVGEEGESALTKLGSTSSFSTGDNIVVVATGSEWAKHMYQETVSTSYVSYKDFDGEVATIAKDDKNYFTLSAGTNNTWKLGDATNGYLYNSSSNDLSISTANSTDWTIAWVGSESKFSIKNGNRWLSCRSDLNGDNQYKFRGGGTSSTIGTVYFDIYRYSNAGTSYSDYCTKVVIREISSIAVETAPTTINYYEGEKFNPEGLKITVNYTEGDPEVVAYAGNEAKFTFSPALDADLTAANTQVTITYKDKTCQQAVNVRTVSINAPTAVEGTYTVKVGEAEAVTADGNTIAAKKGQKIVLASTANTGYRVQSTPFVVKDEDDQTVSVSTAGGQYSFTMPGKNVTITAKFSKLYTLTAADMTNGSIAIKWNDTEVSEAVKGNKIVIDVTPSEHYHLNSLYYMTEGNETQNTIDQTDDIYSFTMEDANTTIYVTFEEDEKHDVVFSVNGDESDPVSVYTGEAIVFPAEDPDAPTGMAFMGWAKNAIDGTQETKPETFTSETMGNDDITFFAVFATEDTGSGPSGSITLSKETISGLKTTQWAYDNTGKTLTEDDYTWTFDGTYHGSGLSYLQLGQKSGLIHTPTCPGNITSIVINCKGASGRNLQVYSGDTKVGDAESTPTSDNDVTLTISGSYTQLNIANHDGNGGYSSSNNAININSITVNYGSAPTYSNYCTKVGPTVTTSNGVTTVRGVVSGTDVATVTTGVTAGTSLDMTGASVSDDVLSSISTAVTGQNILIYAPETSSSTATNVVVNGTCENLVLTDKVAVNIPEEILASNITYERKTGGIVDVLAAGKYATVYLPYAFPVGDYFQVMEFSGINDNGVVSFTYVEETKANVPYIIRPKNVEEASLSFNIEDDVVSVTTTTTPAAPVGEGLSVNDKETDKMLTRRKVAQGDEGATGFYGTYEELTLNGNNGYYGFASGVFKKANTTSGTLIRPFRAYLFVDGTSSTRLATFSFEEKDNLVTRVNNVIEALENNEPMYDLNGHAISEPVRGQINIIRGQKVMFK